jgi:PAS domain S-box-containing protein
MSLVENKTASKWSFTHKARFAIGLALGMLAVMTILAFLSIRNFKDDSNLVSHTNRVIARLEELRSLVGQAESSQRGYLISQQPTYLDPYNEAIQAIPSKIAELRALISDNPVQQNNVNVLQPLIQQRLDSLQKEIGTNQQQGFEAIKALIQKNNGFQLMGQIHDNINAMIVEETSLLQQRSDKAQTGSTHTSLTFLMLAFLSACLLLLLSYMVRQFSNDRKQAEAQLTEQREFATNILNLSPVGKLVIDTDHRVLVWNPALEKLTGITQSEMVGTRNHHTAFYQEDRPLLSDMIIDQDFSQLGNLYDDYSLQPKSYGQSIRVERWFANLHGKRRYVAFEANPIYNRYGTLKAAMTTFQDLTHYKKIEDALRESETRFRLLIEKITVGVTLNGPNSEVLLANDAAANLLGLTLDQLLGKTSFDPEWKCIYEDGTDFPGDKHPIPMAVRTRKPVRNVTMGVYRPKDRSWIWLLISAEPLLDEEGYITNVITSFSDITERKEVEQLKTEFISVVSHELRTPLTSILGSLGLIMGGVAGVISPATRSMLDIAHKNSERLVRLINDILDIEKIESGKMIFHLKPLEVAPLVEQAIESTHSYAEQYGVSFECEVAGDSKHLKVMADADRLTQVMVNLLSNAAKFSPRSEVVKISVLALDARWVRISVNDKGPGISEEFKGRIFQKFAQADASDTRQKGGTGLGLSICKAIVEKFKGTINFTTQLGQGSTFYVDLPLLVEKANNEPPALPDGSYEMEKVAKFQEILRLPELNRAMKVLISEDDHDIAMFLFETFRHLGFECDIAYNASETRRFLADNRYTLMTLDLLLPDEDGIKLLREIRNQKLTRQMPVIVVSAKATEGKIEFNGQAFTVIDWLDKPVDQARLLAAVKTATRPGSSENHYPRILHIEDDRDLVKVIGVLLGDIAEVESARTAREALNKLEREKFDLILLDVELPDSTSASLPTLLNNPALGTIPVVVFSGDEVDPDVSRKIAAGLIKSRTSNQELINTIQSVFKNLGIATRPADKT